MENDRKYQLYKFTEMSLVYNFFKQNIILERKTKKKTKLSLKKNQTYKLK